MSTEVDEESNGLAGVAIVLDTNHLDQTSLLKDPLSVAMLFYLGQLDGHLVLPEVVKIEWSEHWRDHMRKQYKSWKSLRNWLSGHIDGVPEFDLDTDAAAARSFSERLDELGDLLAEEPIEDEDWRAAGRIVIEKRPPSSEGSQQYKDSLLWRALLRVAEDGPVLLVTADKGFLSAGKDALAPDLASEASELDVDIKVVTSRPQLLEQLKAQAQSFVSGLEGVGLDVEEPFLDALNAVLGPEGLAVGAYSELTTGVFATADPKKIVVAIEADGQVSDPEDPEADMPWYFDASGSALVDLESWDTQVSLDKVVFQVLTPHGDHVKELLRSAPSGRRRVMTKLDIAPSA